MLILGKSDQIGPGFVHMRMTVAIVVSAIALLAAGRPGDAAEQVELSEGGLRAIAYRPEGSGPFPAVVVVHVRGAQ